MARNTSNAHKQAHAPLGQSGMLVFIALAAMALSAWLIFAVLSPERQRNSWQLPIAFHVLLTVIKMSSDSIYNWSST